MSLFRPNLDRISGYVPGEQPRELGWVKLNTNENPYPPSPLVIEAIKKAAERLHVYPDPLGTTFRQLAADQYGLDPDWILPGNGSDECLTLIMRSFVDPNDLVVYPYPSYILYETLADLQGGRRARLILNRDWSWNFQQNQHLLEQAKLALVPNPNSPSGNRFSDNDLLRTIPPRGLLVLDEAYGDFCDFPHQGELLQKSGNRMMITRTLSKSFSLAGLRLGWVIAHPDLIAGLRKMKDSYNCDTLSLAAGVAALSDLAWMRANVKKIRSTRSRLTARLREIGFQVVDSQTNFVWATHPRNSHRSIYEELKARKILVRYMNFPDWSLPGEEARSTTEKGPAGDGLRITVGTDGEIDQLLDQLVQVLSKFS